MGDLRVVVRTRVWISKLDIPGNIDSKIKSKHDLTGEDVHDALVAQPGVIGETEDHPEYGTRKIVWAETFSGVKFRAYLYIVDEPDGHYRLGTAYEEE